MSHPRTELRITARAVDLPEAIEIDLSPSRVARSRIYASLGVAEVWRFDGASLSISVLRPDGTYAEAEESRFLPILPSEVVHWVGQVDIDDESLWARRLLEWIRAEVLPRQPR